MAHIQESTKFKSELSTGDQHTAWVAAQHVDLVGQAPVPGGRMGVAAAARRQGRTSHIRSPDRCSHVQLAAAQSVQQGAGRRSGRWCNRPVVAVPHVPGIRQQAVRHMGRMCYRTVFGEHTVQAHNHVGPPRIRGLQAGRDHHNQHWARRTW